MAEGSAKSSAAPQGEGWANQVHPGSPVDERLLPPQIRRMIRAIGLPATITLLQALGGTRIDLPFDHTGNERPRGRSRRALAELVGAKAAKAFYQEFCGPKQKEISLPKVDKILMQARNAAIYREFSAPQEDSIRTLALRYKLTRRQVQNILASRDYPIWRKAPPQLDLFDNPAEPV